jgi:hypothetical protein
MVNIVPKSEIFSVFKNLNYKPWYALGEYVDNSVQSFIDWGKQPDNSAKPKILRVNIDIAEKNGKSSITVEDNARGIEIAEFERAFKVASRPPQSSSRMNEFGMGMKTASFWFANRWQVRTSVYGEPIERMMLFDLQEILKNEVSEIDPISFGATQDRSYTIIVLEDLNQLPKTKTITKIRSYLGSMYRKQLLAGDLEIFVNGDQVSWTPPGILSAPYVKGDSAETVSWRKEISIDLGGDKKVSGWVGLKDTASNLGTGFALFRRGRLIQGGPDDPYSPKAISSTANKIQHMRLFGELDVIGFSATHTKDAIDWEDLEEDFIERLKIELRAGDYDFIYQAIHYKVPKPRGLQNSPDDLSADGLNAQVGIPINKAPEFYETITQINQTGGKEALPDSLDNDAQLMSEINYEHMDENGSLWSAKVRIVDSLDSKLLSVSGKLLGEESRIYGRVEIEVSTSHPFFVAFSDPDWRNLEPLMQFFGVLGIALAYSKYEGAKSQALLDAVNRIALRWNSDAEPN